MTRKKQSERPIEEILEEYRRRNANRKLDPEEAFEMRAAFGEGATVVDVITGQKFKL